jgi:hypothetical protein
MPRDSSGNYTLPVGNPVIDGTVIDVNWANPTMNDIAVQLNNVITRDGLLGPTLPMYFVDGTPALPGIAFNAQHGTGIWRDSTQIGVSYAGVAKQTWGVAGTTIVGTVGLSDGSALSWGDGSVKIVGDSATDILTSFTAGVERMRIDAVGNVGIGGTAPAGTALYVSRPGGSAITVQSGTSSDAGVRTKTTIGDFIFGTAVSTAGVNCWNVYDINAGAERMRIDAAGNVGIGKSNPNQLLQLERNGSAIVTLQGGAGANQSGAYYVNNGGGGGALLAWGDAAAITGGAANTTAMIFTGSTPLAFVVNSVERMRIDSAGWVGIGTAAAFFNGAAGAVNIQTSNAAPLGLRNSNTANTFWQIGPDNANTFLVYNQASAGVFLPSGATAWVANSDEGLKTGFVEFSNAADAVASLRAGTGRFLDDEEGVLRSFLMAQDVLEVLPEAVYEAPDGHLGIAYTEVIPLLVAAVKELRQRIINLGG